MSFYVLLASFAAEWAMIGYYVGYVRGYEEAKRRRS